MKAKRLKTIIPVLALAVVGAFAGCSSSNGGSAVEPANVLFIPTLESTSSNA